MIELQAQSAYVLKRQPYRENHYLLDLFTQTHGRIRASARITKHKTYRNTNLYNPFQRLSIDGRHKGELANIWAATITQTIPLPITAQLAGHYLNELILSLVPSHDPDPELFAHYEHTLHNLRADTLRTFEYTLIQQLGLWPEISATGQYYRLHQHSHLPYLAPSPTGYDAELIDHLNRGEIPNHPQLKHLLQSIISLHSRRQAQTKPTAIALKQLLR